MLLYHTQGTWNLLKVKSDKCYQIRPLPDTSKRHGTARLTLILHGSQIFLHNRLHNTHFVRRRQLAYKTCCQLDYLIPVRRYTKVYCHKCHRRRTSNIFSRGCSTKLNFPLKASRFSATAPPSTHVSPLSA